MGGPRVREREPSVMSAWKRFSPRRISIEAFRSPAASEENMVRKERIRASVQRGWPCMSAGEWTAQRPRAMITGSRSRPQSVSS
jgi:hypothetical protein